MTYRYDYCKCLKCGKFYKEVTALEKEKLEKLGKEGCLDCQSKNLEWKIPIEGYYLIWTTDECPKCSKPKVIDIANWEEYKEKRGWSKSKQEAIDSMNKGDDNCCSCWERERERERAKLGSIGNPHE